MKRLASLFALFCLTVTAFGQPNTVIAYWNFTTYPITSQPVARVTIQPIPPYSQLNSIYQIPAPITFIPGTYPQITNGVVSTNVAVNTFLKVTFSGPFGSRSVTNFFPSILTNSAGPYNASVYDCVNMAVFNNFLIGVWFNGTNFLGAGLAPTNLTGAQGITIGGVYPNYIVGANGQIVTNMDTLAVALSNNFSASNITANANLTVATNVTASGVTAGAGITNQSLTTNQPMFASTGGQEISVPISTFTNGVNAALTALNTATSNALTATNTALLVTIAAGSNSIATSLANTNTALLATITTSSNAAASALASTNTALLVTIAAGSNSISGQLAATNAALLVTIGAGSNSIASQLAATNTAILATITTSSNFFAASLAGTNAALVTRIINATNAIDAASLTGLAPVGVLPPATVSQLGVVRADNATITNVGGVLYAVNSNTGTIFSISGDGTLLTNTITHSGSFATVPAAGFTFLGGPQGAGPGIPSYQPYSNITNAISTQLLALNTGTSNALTATNAALLVTVGAGSNAIAGQLAATNTALLATILAGSNAIAGQLAATNTALLVTIAATSNNAASSLIATNAALLVKIIADSNSIAGSLAATNTALLATILATSNAPAAALAATNAALLVTIAAGSNSIANSLAATNTALLVTIAAGSNSIANALAATNTALLTTIATGSNAIATALSGTNTALVSAIINATNTINASSLVSGPAPVGVLPVATSGALGIARPDNVTVTVSGGVLSAVGGGGGGSQTPWTQDINGAGHNLTNVGSLNIGAGVVNGAFQVTPLTTNAGTIIERALVIGDNNWFTSGTIGAALGFYSDTGQIIGWTNDTGFSRVTGSQVALGNGIQGDHSGTFITGGIVTTNTTNIATLSAAFLGTDANGKIIAPSTFNASVITNVPGTNRFYDDIGILQVDTNFDLFGTFEVHGTNAPVGEVLTAIDGAGHAAFRPGGGGGGGSTFNSTQFFSDGTKTNLVTNQNFLTVTSKTNIAGMAYATNFSWFASFFNLIGVGDSKMFGVNADLSTQNPSNFVNQLSNLIYATGTPYLNLVTNTGISGWTTTNVYNDFTTHVLPNLNGTNDLVIDDAYYNNFHFGDTVQNVEYGPYGLSNYFYLLRQNHVKRIGMIIDVTSGPVYGAGSNSFLITQILQVNDWLSQNTNIDYLIPLNAVLQDNTDSLYFLSDHQHFTGQGYLLEAKLAMQVLNSPPGSYTASSSGNGLLAGNGSFYGNVGIGVSPPTSSTAMTFEVSNNAVGNGGGLRFDNGSADGTNGGWGIVMQAGATAFGINQWQKATVLEGDGDGGTVVDAFNAPLHLQQGRNTYLSIGDSALYTGININNPLSALSFRTGLTNNLTLNQQHSEIYMQSVNDLTFAEQPLHIDGFPLILNDGDFYGRGSVLIGTTNRSGFALDALAAQNTSFRFKTTNSSVGTLFNIVSGDYGGDAGIRLYNDSNNVGFMLGAIGTNGQLAIGDGVGTIAGLAATPSIFMSQSDNVALGFPVDDNQKFAVGMGTLGVGLWTKGRTNSISGTVVFDYMSADYGNTAGNRQVLTTGGSIPGQYNIQPEGGLTVTGSGGLRVGGTNSITNNLGGGLTGGTGITISGGVNATTVISATAGGSGTVTSVTFTGDGTVLSSTPSGAVTTTGTLTAALANAGQNTILAGPPTGGAGAPTYQLVPTFNGTNIQGIIATNNAQLNYEPYYSGPGTGVNGISWAPATNVDIVSTRVWSNIPPLILYTNTSGSLQNYTVGISNQVAAVLGASTFTISVSNANSSGWSNVATIGMNSLITSIAMLYSNSASVWIDTNAVLAMTNTSTGTGNAAGEIPNTGCIVTIGNATASGVPSLGGNNVFTGTQTYSFPNGSNVVVSQTGLAVNGGTYTGNAMNTSNAQVSFMTVFAFGNTISSTVHYLPLNGFTTATGSLTNDSTFLPGITLLSVIHGCIQTAAGGALSAGSNVIVTVYTNGNGTGAMNPSALTSTFGPNPSFTTSPLALTNCWISLGYSVAGAGTFTANGSFTLSNQ